MPGWSVAQKRSWLPGSTPPLRERNGDLGDGDTKQGQGHSWGAGGEPGRGLAGERLEARAPSCC